ncbi:MAG: hypothetical protein WA705_26525 [Candidatus Ozemobacteraceae bacterium]
MLRQDLLRHIQGCKNNVYEIMIGTPEIGKPEVFQHIVFNFQSVVPNLWARNFAADMVPYTGFPKFVPSPSLKQAAGPLRIKVARLLV